MDAKAHDISHTHGTHNQRYMDTILITQIFFFYSLYVYRPERMGINEIKVKIKLLDTLLFFKINNVFASNQLCTKLSKLI